MIIELFSTRRKRAAMGGKKEVFVYDTFPSALRVQLQQIFLEAIESQDSDPWVLGSHESGDFGWAFIRRVLCREKGVHTLSRRPDPAEDVIYFLAETQSSDDFLDAVEICCKYIDNEGRRFNEHHRQILGIRLAPDDAIEEMNYRFRAAGVGYEFSGGYLLRKDAEFIHSEIIKPALVLLSAPGFDGPEREFLEAHKHFRSGNHKDAIVWANKSFESVMKAICDRKGWSYEKGARASDLLKVIRKRGLLPDYLDASFDQLTATLASGLPQVRNNEGGHGDGPVQRSTPDYIAAYALSLAASKISLLMRASTKK